MTLLIIDMQKGLVVEDLFNREILVNNLKLLLEEARNNNVEVIYFKHDAGEGSGLSKGDEEFEIIDELAPKDDEKVFEKTINSCFGNKSFDEYISQKNDKNLMIVGLQTEFCIDSTIKSAFEKGFKVYIPKGTNSTFDNKYFKAKRVCKYYNEWIWQGSFAECITLNTAIRLLKKRNKK